MLIQFAQVLRRTMLSKRKVGTLRNRDDSRYNTQYKMRGDDKKTYYMNESRTIIDFNKLQQERTKPRKTIDLIPKSINQESYILALLDNTIDIVIASGPAGTGKTYLGMLAAIKSLRAGECEKLVLTRPAVGVDDEKHGFLPGDLNSKMEPWTRPLFDVLYEYYSIKEVSYMIEEQIIEISPLAFMRGRNFKHSWILLDEAQNATPSQLKMLMTRIGTKSKIVIAGDIEQTDRGTAQNGLLDLIRRLNTKEISGIQSCRFDIRDVQRHYIIPHILELYS